MNKETHIHQITHNLNGAVEMSFYKTIKDDEGNQIGEPHPHRVMVTVYEEWDDMIARETGGLQHAKGGPWPLPPQEELAMFKDIHDKIRATPVIKDRVKKFREIEAARVAEEEAKIAEQKRLDEEAKTKAAEEAEQAREKALKDEEDRLRALWEKISKEKN